MQEVHFSCTSVLLLLNMCYVLFSLTQEETMPIHWSTDNIPHSITLPCGPAQKLICSGLLHVGLAVHPWVQIKLYYTLWCIKRRQQVLSPVFFFYTNVSVDSVSEVLVLFLCLSMSLVASFGLNLRFLGFS